MQVSERRERLRMRLLLLRHSRFKEWRVKVMDGSMFIGTWWALIPPLLAIILAFVTKEVYSTLFLGVAVGAMLYSGFHPWESFVNFFEIMKDSMNLNILIFDVLLGMIIVLMAKTGGSAAYGKWAGTKIK